MDEHNDPPQEPTLPSKRSSEPDLQDLPSKIPKLDLKETLKQTPNDDTSEPVNDDNEDDDDDDDDEEEEREVDRKGKGIMRDDKGKGKMIAEDDADDGDSDSEDDGDTDSGDDDDFSDDPLTEVDLNNILPSRTRGRAATVGVQIAGVDSEKAVAAAAANDDSDSDDDSDA